ncbi:MAG: hypothetical protein AAB319_09010, partial [Pseudomonadota bacterium]
RGPATRLQNRYRCVLLYQGKLWLRPVLRTLTSYEVSLRRNMVLLQQDHIVPMDQHFFIEVAEDGFDFMGGVSCDAAGFSA